MKGRRPRGDELELWQAVARTTRPYRPERAPTPPSDRSPATRKEPKPERQPLEIRHFVIGESAPTHSRESDTPAGVAKRLEKGPVRMDSKAFERLRRGKLKPEARIDLHGMTLDQARPALMAFLMASHAQSRRLVLVITGKGKHSDDASPIPSRRGALRHNVPVWLQQTPLAQIVQQVAPAHTRHGGHGALYVFLRRKR